MKVKNVRDNLALIDDAIKNCGCISACSVEC